MRRAIVHISGYSLGEDPKVDAIDKVGQTKRRQFGDYEHVVWGDPDTYKLGRTTMGLYVARQLDAEIMWSTGASRLQNNGVSEAHAMYLNALNRYSDLNGQFPHRFTKRTWRTDGAYRAWLMRVSRFDEVSTNTMESMNVLRERIHEATRSSEHVDVYLVSSANHVPRVLRDAMIAFDIGTIESRFMQRVSLFAVPAETNYGKKQVQDVVVNDLGC